jgi:phosphonate transport system ATP-binding protein
MIALIGTSGSGKSTLLRHLSGLIPGDRRSGIVRVLGRTVQRDGRVSRDIHRTRARVGFIFQQFNLVGRLPVLTNVLTGTLARVPLWRSSLYWFTPAEKRLALEALSRVGLREHAFQRASTLSGGQQQRAAIARTLVQQAEVVLADEPIASLDPESSRRVMEILSRINREDGTTVIVSLHQVDFALRYCPRAVALKAGQVVYDGPSSRLSPGSLQEIYSCPFSSPDTADELEDECPIPDGARRVGAMGPSPLLGAALDQ